MFQVNDDNSIYVTRGDIVFLAVTAEDDGKPYTFQPGEILRFKVFGKKDAESVAMQKDFPVTAVTQTMELFLDGEDTKIGEVISKPRDYWYEVELNPFDNPQTIIGYGEDGPCVFRLFPEGADIPEYVPDPEVIKVIDTELDMKSERPVQNQVIARAFANLQAGYQAIARSYVTPETYNAVGDGESDDTEALRLAFATGFVSLTCGKTYCINKEVDVPAGARIEGNHATIKCGAGACLKVVGDNAHIERVDFVGSGADRYGIEVVAGVKNTRIYDVRGTDMAYTLIMNDGEETVISGASAYNCGWDCVSNYGHAKNATIRDCFAIRCGRHGFSADEGADGISFINCYAEDIGWIDGEGHTCFHLEGATNSKIINCRAVYTENHPAVSGNFTGVLNACRIEAAKTLMINNTIDGLDIIYKEGFTSHDNQVIALFFHSAVSDLPTIHIRNLYIKNLAEIQALVYHGNVHVHLDGFDVTGNVFWKQQNTTGYLLSMKNGNVYGSQGFYYAQYGNRGMLCKNVIIKDSTGLLNGRFVDCVIENCVFENCDYSVSLVQNAANANEKSSGNIFRNNLLNGLDNGVVLGWWTGTENNLIIDNVFKGAFVNLLSGSYCGCVFAGNIDGGATFDTLAHNVTPVTEKPLVGVS